jgi:hypothetical protein
LGIASISVVDANVVWAAAFDSSYSNSVKDFTRTINGGTTWMTGTVAGAPNGWDITCISAINKDTAWVSMADNNNGGGRIYQTLDGGVNWTRQNSSAFGNPDGWADLIHFWNANDGVCVGDTNTGWWEVYTTIDGGNNWTRIPIVNIPANLSQEFGNDNVFSVIGNTIWFGTDAGRVYKSVDKGMNWTVSVTGLPNITSIAFRDANNGLAEDNYSLVSTSDGGATWTAVASDDNEADGWMCFAPGNPGAYFTTEYWGDPNGWSSYSIDNGATWIVIDSLAHGAVGFLNQNVGWSGGWNTSSTVDGMYKWAGAVGITEIGNETKSVNVFPNPMNDVSIVKIPSGTGKVDFILYNVTGEKVEELKNISDTQIEIKRGNKPSGIYFYQVSNEKGVVGTGKIIIE